MRIKGKKVLVTGGVGFIGSKLAESLLKLGCRVRVIDDLSVGSIEAVRPLLKNKNFEFIKGDLLEEGAVKEGLEGREVVFHFAANPDVRAGSADPWTHLEQNVIVTYRLLEGLRSQPSKTLVFASSSTVYGEAEEIPTREPYGPLLPISVYGASKLACEALISAYFNTFKVSSMIFRLANIIGPTSSHGALIDFVEKLKRDSRQLEILGDGTQKKSYLYVDDCVDAIIYALEHTSKPFEIFNVGAMDCLSVETIADLVSERMGVAPRYVFRGEEGGRGWKGDVRLSWLSIEKLKKIGWKPRHSSEQSIRRVLDELLESFPDKIDF